MIAIKKQKTIFPTALRHKAKLLGDALISQHATVAVAESCTGGMIGEILTANAGSSAYFAGGVIAYSNHIKQTVLSVPKIVLDKNGAVSSETVTFMAQNVRTLFKTDYAIAVSGIAGPDGGTKKKPVGLVYIGIAFRETVKSYKCNFAGSRQSVRNQTVYTALSALTRLLR